MIYRILGGISLAIGGLFGLVAFLVFLPFLSNLNVGLLILAGVFAILGWVFVSIGWQLFHPPASSGVLESVVLKSAAEEEPSHEEEVTAAAVPEEVRANEMPAMETPVRAHAAAEEAQVAAAAVAGLGEGPIAEEHAGVKESPRIAVAGGGENRATAGSRARSGSFVGFEEERSGNGEGDRDATDSEAEEFAGRRTRFKKPGAPVPPRKRE